MIQARALKAFQSRYGFLRVGSRFTCEPEYFDQLKANQMVELIPERNEPNKHRAAMLGAPSKPGKVLPPLHEAQASAAQLVAPELPSIDGSAKPLPVSPRVRRSRKMT